jgi:hypothetical protein
MFKKRALFLFADVRNCPTTLSAAHQTASQTKNPLFWLSVAVFSERLHQFFLPADCAHKVVESAALVWVFYFISLFQYIGIAVAGLGVRPVWPASGGCLISKSEENKRKIELIVFYMLKKIILMLKNIR